MAGHAGSLAARRSVLDPMKEKRLRVVVTGWVQGVGYRMSCQHEAWRLGVSGWVRNRWDGSVEALLVGPADAVDAMVQWCRRGPEGADVEGVEATEEPAGPPVRGFSVRSTNG